MISPIARKTDAEAQRGDGADHQRRGPSVPQPKEAAT
jgi:hypothetical protein